MARVAIEFTPAVYQGGGVARSVLEMTAALLAAGAHDYNLFVAGSGSLPDPIARLKPTVTRAPFSSLTLTRLWHRLRIPLPVELFSGRNDLFFATDFALPPTLPGTRTAVFIHDLTFVRVPDAAVPELVTYLGAVVPRALKRANVVIVNSQATKADLIDIYGTPPDKIVQVQFGVHPRFARSNMQFDAIRARYELPERPFVFAVGTLQPRKNYVRLIAALGKLRSAGVDAALVIAGGKGWLESPIYDAVRAAKLEPFVTFLGYVDDADLPALYTYATAFAMPSLYEGFGLPVLEAMACGTPVVTSNTSSLPEAAGDAALLVDPTDSDAIADALMRVFSMPSLRSGMIQRGYRHVAQYSWDRTAEQLAVAFDNALLG